MNQQQTTQNQTPAMGSLYVGDLHPDVTEAQLYEKFSPNGAVLSVRVCRDMVTRKSLGYAYVNFQNPTDAENALENMNFDEIKGRPIRIMWSQRDPSLRKSGVGNIFIKNLNKDIVQKELYDTFIAFGNILSCKIASDENGKSKGYGFVHFETEEGANSAIQAVNDMIINEKRVYVGKFIPKGQRNAGDSVQRFTNCFVKNFGDELDTPKLEELFGKYGEITSAKVMVDAAGKSKGFGFVCFKEAVAAENAVHELNGFRINDKTIYVARAQKKQERVEELRVRFEKQKIERTSRYAQGVNLYVKNLDDTISDDRLQEEFRPFGVITSAKVMCDGTGRSKGFGFVCFSCPGEAAKAVSDMNGKICGSKPLYVALAQRKDDRKTHLANQYLQRMSQYRNPGLAAAHAAAAAQAAAAGGLGGPAGGPGGASGVAGVGVGGLNPLLSAQAAAAVNAAAALGGPGGPVGPGAAGGVPASAAQAQAAQAAQAQAVAAQAAAAAMAHPYYMQQHLQAAAAGGAGGRFYPPSAAQAQAAAAQFVQQQQQLSAQVAAGRGANPLLGGQQQRGPQAASGWPGAGPGASAGLQNASLQASLQRQLVAGSQVAGVPVTGAGGAANDLSRFYQQQQQAGSQNAATAAYLQQQQQQQQQRVERVGGPQGQVPRAPNGMAPQRPSMASVVGRQQPPQQPNGAAAMAAGAAGNQPTVAAGSQVPVAAGNQPTAVTGSAAAAAAAGGQGEQGQITKMLAEFNQSEQKQWLGEHLFPKVENIQPKLAGKITGMLLEMDNSELLHMLESADSLRVKVDEALSVLQNHKNVAATGAGQQPGSGASGPPAGAAAAGLSVAGATGGPQVSQQGSRGPGGKPASGVESGPPGTVVAADTGATVQGDIKDSGDRAPQ